MLPKYKPCSTDHVTLLPNQTGVDRSLIQIFSHLKLKYIFHENEVIPFHSTPGIGPNITTHYEKSPQAAPFLLSLQLSSFHFMLGTSAHSHSCPSNITFPRGQVINRLGFKGLPYMEREQKRGNWGNNYSISKWGVSISE